MVLYFASIQWLGRTIVFVNINDIIVEKFGNYILLSTILKYVTLVDLLVGKKVVFQGF